MYKITSDQMKRVLAVIGKPVEEQASVFKLLDFNPYEFYDDNDPNDYFNIVLSKRELEERVLYVQKYPEEFDGFTESRLGEIESGSEITSEEAEAIKESYIEEKREDDCPETWAIIEISDGITSIYAFYFEQVWGRDGLNLNNFWGFFENEADAVKALEAMDLVEI